MAPKWFDINNIPYDQMWEDDQYWLPKVLKGENIKAIFKFDKDLDLVKKDVNIMSSLI
jgi:hypothetical protein